MLYYLSYVEISSEHACLMLAKQEKRDQPAEIIKTIGFWPRINNDEGQFVENFKKYEGELRTEDAASRAAYSSSRIFHRTFEISSYEKALFLKLIADDKQINYKPFLDNRKINYVGGPDYEYLRFNCKAYALNVLDRMGIVEAKELNDFLIQTPGRKNNQLTEIKKPDYDRSKIIFAYRALLDKIELDLEKCLPDPYDAQKFADISAYKSYIDQNFPQAVKLQALVNELRDRISDARNDGPDKIGTDYDLSHFDKLIGLMDKIKILANPKMPNSLDNHIVEMKSLYEQAKIIKVEKNEIICPKKDSYILDVHQELDALKILLQQEQFQGLYLKKIMDKIREEIAATSLQRQEKIGITSFNSHFLDIHDLLIDLENRIKKNKNLKHFDLFDQHLLTLSNLHDRAKEIDKDYESLPFYWSGTPKLVQRAEITTRNQAYFSTSIKIKALNDRLEDLLEILHQATIRNKTNLNFQEDIDAITKMVEKAQNDILVIVPKLNNKNISNADLVKLDFDAKKIVANLEKNIKEYVPNNPKSNFFIRMIDTIITLFRKNYIAHDADLVAKSALATTKKKAVSSTAQLMAQGLKKDKPSSPELSLTEETRIKLPNQSTAAPKASAENAPQEESAPRLRK